MRSMIDSCHVFHTYIGVSVSVKILYLGGWFSRLLVCLTQWYTKAHSVRIIGKGTKKASQIEKMRCVRTLIHWGCGWNSSSSCLISILFSFSLHWVYCFSSVLTSKVMEEAMGLISLIQSFLFRVRYVVHSPTHSRQYSCRYDHLSSIEPFPQASLYKSIH